MDVSTFFLSLNESKSEIVVLTPLDTHYIPNLNVGVLALYIKQYIKNLGVALVCDLKVSFPPSRTSTPGGVQGKPGGLSKTPATRPTDCSLCCPQGDVSAASDPALAD